MDQSDELYAHTPPTGEDRPWQGLNEHLENVAQRAAEFARPIGFEEWAYALGMLHDLGKADERFQARLHGARQPFDHPAPGARYALEHYGIAGGLLAPLVLGHHRGIPDEYSDNDGTEASLHRRLYESTNPDNLVKKIIAPPLQLSTDPYAAIGAKITSCNNVNAQNEFFFSNYVICRLLHSALVDSDWLDTEAYTQPAKAALRDYPKLSLENLLERLTSHLAEKQRHAAPTEVNKARSSILESCCQGANNPPGLFTLEVPTGSGKTLSSLAFALRHAINNGQKRIIYAIPFTSIVEQTAQVFREIFGDENVLEHHSNYDFPITDDTGQERADRDRLLVQNWDAPLIVTTNVQLFESLFSNRPSKSRKVHNVAESVIILDEVQTLPEGLLKPTLAILETLPIIASTSIVLCTATQPGLDTLWPFHSQPLPLAPNLERLSPAFADRVRFIANRIGDDDAYLLDELADEIAQQSQVLVVVSSRQAARLLYEALKDNDNVDKDSLYHLSALMVPAHRSQHISAIKERLAEDKPCVVVSTQLIEAGVDVDFPRVYRELTGLDSILQAAGRCNREGFRTDEPGIVTVFECQEFIALRSNKKTWLSKLRDIGYQTITASQKNGLDPFKGPSVRAYFDSLHATSDQDEYDIFNDLENATITSEGKQLFYHCDFASIAQRYRFIDSKNELPLFIPWGDKGQALLQELEANPDDRMAFNRVQRFSVSIPSWKFRTFKNAHALRSISPWCVLETRTGAERLYDESIGLLEPGGGTFETLIQ